MREYYEPVLNLSDPEHHSMVGAFLTLKPPVDGDMLRSAVEALRTRFPYFYVRVASGGEDEAIVPNDLPMSVRNTWEPITFNTEAANFHLAAWKYINPIGTRIFVLAPFPIPFTEKLSGVFSLLGVCYFRTPSHIS